MLQIHCRTVNGSGYKLAGPSVWFILIIWFFDITMAIYQTLPDEIQEVDVVIAGGTCECDTGVKEFIS